MRFALLIFGISGVLLLMRQQFPYAVASVDQRMHIVYLIIMLVLLSGSGLLRRLKSHEVARNILLWLAITVVLVLGYSFRSDLKHSRLFSELVPSRIQVDESGAVSVISGEDGHFHMEATVNGSVQRFLIDTGASDIVLSPAAAQEAGYDITHLNFSRTYHTANGVGSGAPIRITVLQIGSITLRDVPAAVNNADMDESLLGIAFLNQFQRYTVDGDRLTLYP